MTISEDGFPDGSAMTDPRVYVHLTSGRIVELDEVSIVEIAKSLYTNGFVFLADGEGSYAVFFRHGVCALTVPNQRDSN